MAAVPGHTENHATELQQLRSESAVEVELNTFDGQLRSLVLDVPLPDSKDIARGALQFLRDKSGLFGFHPETTLVVEGVASSDGNQYHIQVAQMAGHLRVVPSQIKVTVVGERVRMVSAVYLRAGTVLPPVARLSREEAAARAIEASGFTEEAHVIGEPREILYIRDQMMGFELPPAVSSTGRASSAWWVVVYGRTESHSDSMPIVVSGDSGEVLLKGTNSRQAEEIWVRNANTGNDLFCYFPFSTTEFTETGNAIPSPSSDGITIYNSLTRDPNWHDNTPFQDTIHAFWLTYLGIDSFDNKGAELVGTHNVTSTLGFTFVGHKRRVGQIQLERGRSLSAGDVMRRTVGRAARFE